MKITAVKPILLSGEYGAPHETELRQHYPLGKRSAAYVQIETDAGITGLGETYAGVFVPELAAQLIAMIGAKLIGYHAHEISQLHAMMTRYVSYWGYTGFAKNVISGIECALWDAKGKAFGVPVYELLGGARVNEIALYASGGIAKSLDDLAVELKAYADAGFTAVKIRDREYDLEVVRRSRAAIGADVGLIVDANHSFTPRPARVTEALRYAETLRACDVLFWEEPLGVDDFSGYQQLVAARILPISGGETLNSAGLFRQHIDGRAFNIVQPDASVVGGIGECFEVLRYAEQRGLQGVCHAWASSPCQAANVHAAFAAGSRLLEWAMPYNALREAMLVEPWRIVKGKLQKTTAPGLGVELTDEVQAKYVYLPGTASPGNFR
ncbi:MAG: mandelate racemase/muconate lactonizing enzyme family protein [Blastocatellia bacterium]|nr:mandelate racemase/muconate lactonizing enzyme family protein [Blastocatellia bacterium]